MNFVPDEQSAIHNTRLAMVAKYTHNAIVITDPNGLVEWVNDAFTRITGYTLEEVIGKKPGALLQGDESDPATIEIIRQAIKNEDPFDVELINYTKAGEAYWIRIEGVPLYDSNGILNGFMAIESDITRRKLRQVQTNRLAMVAKYTHNAIVITDADGMVEWTNDGFTRITGFTLDEVKGTKPGSFLQGPESDKAKIDIIRQAIKNEQPFDVELINYTKAGHPYWIRIEGVPLHDSDGTLNGFMAIEADVSSRKLHEDMLIKAKLAAEAANEAKIQFLNNISHELRTPMNGIMGLTSLLEMTELDEEQNSYVDDILKSSERLFQLIENLFVFSKDEMAERASVHNPVDFPPLLESIYKRYSQLASEKGFEFVIKKVADLPSQIVGNRELIYQVIDNLCNNAVKFTKKGGVTLSAEVAGTALDRYMVVKIIDTGIGFDPEQLKEVFTPFKQKDSTLTRGFEGAGIGLYASRNIAQLCGGDIEISSTKGKGTTVQFWWPI